MGDAEQVTAHGNSWKQLYFERNLEGALERYAPLHNAPHDTLTQCLVLHRLSSVVRSVSVASAPERALVHSRVSVGNIPLLHTPLRCTYHTSQLIARWVTFRYDPATTELSALKRLCAFSKRFVRGLHISQLPSHLDLQVLLGTTTGCLTSLSLTYGMLNVGMDYDRSLFGMKLSDCRTLAKALERTETLTYLNLSNNLLDDEKVRARSVPLASASPPATPSHPRL
jgi:hypothetical protein